jgi:hypothetical protein
VCVLASRELQRADRMESDDAEDERAGDEESPAQRRDPSVTGRRPFFTRDAVAANACNPRATSLRLTRLPSPGASVFTRNVNACQKLLPSLLLHFRLSRSGNELPTTLWRRHHGVCAARAALTLRSNWRSDESRAAGRYSRRTDAADRARTSRSPVRRSAALTVAACAEPVPGCAAGAPL